MVTLYQNSRPFPPNNPNFDTKLGLLLFCPERYIPIGFCPVLRVNRAHFQALFFRFFRLEKPFLHGTRKSPVLPLPFVTFHKKCYIPCTGFSQAKTWNKKSGITPLGYYCFLLRSIFQYSVLHLTEQNRWVDLAFLGRYLLHSTHLFLSP